jgi:myo-inositol 2-dehydrogenase/D-chiro-inositol 1-dehydrogenase
MRLGIVGSGGIAARHLEVLPQSDADVDVVAHVSRTRTKADAMATRFGGEAFDTLEAFIRDGRPDAVIVTVPPDQHGETELALIAAGIPFLVEKPIGLNRAVPDAIAERLGSRNLVAAVGYNWRGLDTLESVRRQLAMTPLRMVIGRYHVGTPAAPWWRWEAGSGGQIVEQACHLVDLARHLCGEGELLGAAGHHGALPGFADGDIAGTSAALFRFGDVPGVVTAAAVLPKGPGAELRLICTACEIVISMAAVEIVAGGESRRIGSGASSYAVQNAAFFKAVRSGSPQDVLCTYPDAVLTHHLCLAAAEQIRRG